MKPDMPERDLNPPEATVTHEPDPDDMEFYYIDKQVLQIGTLSERTQQARNDFSQERADPEIMDGLLGEWQTHDAECQQIMSGVSNDMDALIKKISGQAD